MLGQHLSIHYFMLCVIGNNNDADNISLMVSNRGAKVGGWGVATPPEFWKGG